MAIGTVSVGTPVILSASGRVAGGVAMARTFDGSVGATAGSTVAEGTALAGTILGFYCNSTSSGIITLNAGTASGGTALTGQMTPAAGLFHWLPLTWPTGLYMTLISGSINVTWIVVGPN